MGEYTEIQGQIARIEQAYMGVFFPGATKITERLSMGTAFDAANPTSQGTPRDGFYARIGEITEHRPTLAGALLAIEHALAMRIDDQIGDLNRLIDLRAALKLPEITIGGDT